METATISPSRSRAGFGLIGMMVLIVLVSAGAIAIAVVLLPILTNRQLKETQTKGASLRAAISAYVLNHGGSGGTNPASLGALVTNDNSPSTCTVDNVSTDSTYKTLQGWCGPYLDVAIVENATDYMTDGWGTSFQYVSSSGALSSCGPNRICGDGDDISF